MYMYIYMYTCIQVYMQKKKSSGRKYIEIVDSDCQVLTQ